VTGQLVGAEAGRSDEGALSAWREGLERQGQISVVFHTPEPAYAVPPAVQDSPYLWVVKYGAGGLVDYRPVRMPS
jgi:hypothetical protein